MNKKLKKALQNAFEPPKPIHEKEFIKQFPQPTISTLSFVLSQIRYIQKYVWIVSFAVFLIALMGARAFEKDIVGDFCLNSFYCAIACDRECSF